MVSEDKTMSFVVSEKDFFLITINIIIMKIIMCYLYKQSYLYGIRASATLEGRFIWCRGKGEEGAAGRGRAAYTRVA